MKKVIAYEANDGSVHKTEEEAKEHNLMHNLSRWYKDFKLQINETSFIREEYMIDWLLAHRKKLLELLSTDSEKEKTKRPQWPVFLLYDGYSEDGTGSPDFFYRTSDVSIARSHWLKCKNDPYCIGHVDMVEYDSIKRMRTKEDWKEV